MEYRVEKNDLWALFVAGFNFGANYGPIPSLTDENAPDMFKEFQKLLANQPNELSLRIDFPSKLLNGKEADYDGPVG